MNETNGSSPLLSGGIYKVFLILLLLFSLYLGFSIVAPFIHTLIFSTVLAVLFSPVFAWVLNFCKGRRALASLLTVGIIVFCLLLPMTFLVVALIGQGVESPGVAQRLGGRGGPTRRTSAPTCSTNICSCCTGSCRSCALTSSTFRPVLSSIQAVRPDHARVRHRSGQQCGQIGPPFPAHGLHPVLFPARRRQDGGLHQASLPAASRAGGFHHRFLQARGARRAYGLPAGGRAPGNRGRRGAVDSGHPGLFLGGPWLRWPR